MSEGKSKSAWSYLLPTVGGICVTFAAVAQFTAFTAAGLPPIDAAFSTAALGAETVYNNVVTIGGAGIDLIQAQVA